LCGVLVSVTVIILGLLNDTVLKAGRFCFFKLCNGYKCIMQDHESSIAAYLNSALPGMNKKLKPVKTVQLSEAVFFKLLRRVSGDLTISN